LQEERSVDASVPSGSLQSVGPVVALAVYEGLAHSNFLATGHRGLVQTGTWLKVLMDSTDAISHGLLAVTSPSEILSFSHTLLFGWHCAKAMDSRIINGYSPMRGLFLPNVMDTTTYCLSGLLGGAEHPEWALSASIVYGILRYVDCIY
jgi:hypothetical protein